MRNPEAVITEENKNLTKLMEKNFSPMTIRKYTKWGFPMFIGIITDNDIHDIDEVVVNFMETPKNLERWKNDNLQDKRNLCGELSDTIVSYYGKTEGLAVTFSIDKSFISSLFGDFMNHFQCKFEYYTMLNMSTNI